MLRAPLRIRRLALSQGMLPRSISFTSITPIQQDERPSWQSSAEAGPSNYFTANPPSSLQPPATSENYYSSSPFSSKALAESLAHLSVTDDKHLKQLRIFVNIPRAERTPDIAKCIYRIWKQISPSAKKQLSRQTYQTVLRAVVADFAYAPPLLNFATISPKAKDEDAHATTPSHGERLRYLLNDFTNTASSNPDTCAWGPDSADYRYVFKHLARYGDTRNAEEVADFMRHRGDPMTIRHIDSRMLALVRFLNSTRLRGWTLNTHRVEAIVATLWRILGDMQTNRQLPRRITVLLLLRSIVLTRRLVRSAASSQEGQEEGSKLEGQGRYVDARNKSHALELDFLLEEVLQKAHGLDLKYLTVSSTTEEGAAPAPITATTLTALVDHYGRKNDLWKMLSVLHVMGDQVPASVNAGRDGSEQTSGQFHGLQRESEEVEDEIQTLSSMMASEEEGRKAGGIFGWSRSTAEELTLGAVDAEPIHDTETSQLANDNSSLPSINPPHAFYPLAPLPAASPSSSTTPSLSDLATTISHLSYPSSTQRTEAYTVALLHALRSDDWALSLHILESGLRSAREHRAEWLAVRQLRDRVVESLPVDMEEVVETSPNVESAQDLASSPVSSTINLAKYKRLGAEYKVPQPKLAISPTWFLRSHVRMKRFRAAPRFMAKWRDLINSSMAHVREEALFFSALEASQGHLNAATGESETVEATEVEVEGASETIHETIQRLLYEEVVASGKGDSTGSIFEMAHAHDVLADPAAVPSSTIEQASMSSTEQVDIEADSDFDTASVSGTLTNEAQPEPKSEQEPALFAEIIPQVQSHHLKYLLGTYASLRTLLAYELHQNDIRKGRRRRNVLRRLDSKAEREERREMARQERELVVMGKKGRGTRRWKAVEGERQGEGQGQGQGQGHGDEGDMGEVYSASRAGGVAMA